MTRFQGACASLCMAVLAASAPAQGIAPGAPVQAPYARPPISPYPRPTVSPYLNLARGGSTAVNYFNLVRPQQEFLSSLNQLENRTELLEDVRATGAVTGQSSQFMTHGRWFFNLGTRSAPARTATTPPAVSGLARPRN